MPEKVRLGALISGEGTTIQNFIDKIRSGTLNAEIAVVISSRPNVKGLERARLAGIDRYVVNRKDYAEDASFSQAITEILDRYKVDLVTLAGFLSFYEIPDKYLGRVMNIHPALLPKHGGKGFYGDKVHRTVLESGATESGCTVHFADNVYDHGPIITQRRVPVFKDDTIETLRRRVFEEECVAYPQAINMFAEGKLDDIARRIRSARKK
ncbi:MAG: phosphoribosylglycinamide formyltransferase [Planctomycetota bacterium]|nr:MAG: phosphoribosylglycinamide formyltransferase [Planctomycetota bacterium]